MLIRNSLRQMYRTPVRTGLFALLLLFAAMLASLGGNLWFLSSSNLEQLEKNFITIGTVEQRKSSVEQVKEWDAGLQDYRYFNVARYDAPIPVSVLDFEGADYIQKPEKRPSYEAYLPDYHIWDANERISNNLVAEVSPYEDCVPSQPVRLKIHKIYYCSPYFRGDWVSFCDHYNDNPAPLYADRTYIISLSEGPGHEAGLTEYQPSLSTGGLGYTKDGKRIESRTPDVFLEEITEDFYKEGGRWDNWEQLVLLLQNLGKSVPVTPTHSTELLMAFYTGNAYLCEGKDITEEQYEAGTRVCLIEKEFAEDNGLHVGDCILLRLRTADYRFSGGMGFENLFLNPEGEMYSVFSGHEYEIAGIYGQMPAGGYGSGYAMGHCEIVVPWNSIEESDENNIVSYGPMMGYTTSFQIPNGTIDAYMEAWNRQNIDGLTITFYDKGYSQLKDGLDQMKTLAWVLLAAGIITVLLLLLFFIHLFIGGQKRRTAIERSLGMDETQCRYSMMSGIFLIVLAGSLTGSFLGYGFTGETAKRTSEEVYYDNTYSSHSFQADAGEEAEIDYEVTQVWIPFLAAGISLAAACVISDIEMRKNLKCEPLRLLGERPE